MESYCVTGCAGFIGARLAHTLLARGHHVIGIDSLTPYYSRSIKERRLSALRQLPGFELSVEDVEHADLHEKLADVHGVYHLAAQPGVRSSWGRSFEEYTRLNVLATQRMFAAAAERAVPVVFASSSSIYGDAETYPTAETALPRPVSPYGVTKLACEHLAYAYNASFGLRVTALRYFTIYGPGQRPDMAISRLIDALLQERPFRVYGTGEQSRDFTFVDDAVSATIAAMESSRGCAVYNVGGGEEASLLGVIEICEEFAGRRLHREAAPRFAGDALRTSADTSLIRRELGWTPKTSLREGLRAQVADAASRLESIDDLAGKEPVADHALTEAQA
jgi:UDP-glucuronate 4-epimerase